MFVAPRPVASCGPEKLVICIDSVCRSNDIKLRIKNFLELKCMVNPHEIAVMRMTNGGDVEWLCDFDTNIKKVMYSVSDGLQSDNRYSYSSVFSHGDGHQSDSKYGSRRPEKFNISKVFDMVHAQWDNIYWKKDASLRLLMFYSRVDCLPVLEGETSLSRLLSDDAVTIDILYVPQFSRNKAERPSETKRANQIFEKLSELCDERSYIFAVDEPKDLTLYTARLLAHPNLRCNQKRIWSE